MWREKKRVVWKFRGSAFSARTPFSTRPTRIGKLGGSFGRTAPLKSFRLKV